MAIDQFVIDPGRKMIGCIANITDQTIQSLRTDRDRPIHTIDIPEGIISILYPLIQRYNRLFCKLFKFLFDDPVVFDKNAIIMEAVDSQIILCYFVAGSRRVRQADDQARISDLFRMRLNLGTIDFLGGHYHHDNAIRTIRPGQIGQIL